MAGSADPGQPTSYDDLTSMMDAGVLGSGTASTSLNVSMRMRPIRDGRTNHVKSGDIMFMHNKGAVGHDPEVVTLLTLEAVNYEIATKKTDPYDFTFIGFAAADSDPGGPEDQSIAITLEGMGFMRNVCVGVTYSTVKNDEGIDRHVVKIKKEPVYTGQGLYLNLMLMQKKPQEGPSDTPTVQLVQSSRGREPTAEIMEDFFPAYVISTKAGGQRDLFMCIRRIGMVMHGCASGNLGPEQRGFLFPKNPTHASLAPKATVCCRL